MLWLINCQNKRISISTLYFDEIVLQQFEIFCTLRIRKILKKFVVESAYVIYEWSFRRGRSSIFAALYFLPILALIQAICGGLVYNSFPYIVVILSLVSSAFHFAFKLNQSAKALLIGCVKDSRSAVILMGHWVLHGKTHFNF